MNRWKSLDELPEEDGPAIYKMRLNPDRAEEIFGEKKFSRFFKKDKNCILSIGETKKIKTRIKNFRDGMNDGKEGTHSSGRTLHGINKHTKKKYYFDIKDIEYKYRLKKSKTDAEEAEKKEIWEYVEKYGETPPLNGCIPKRKEWIEKE